MRIKEKRVIKLEKPIPVYCLTVPDTHNFFIESNGKSVCVKNCDADPDGKHILSLILTLYHVYMKEILEGGYVYKLNTPLFEVELTNGKRVYCNSQAELSKIKPSTIRKINRNKGLGEISSETFRGILENMDEYLEQYTLEDAENALKMIDLFMGEDSSVRKDYIQEFMGDYHVEE